jgi:hypothetical protein
MDRCTAVQNIQDVFARSPVLRDAVISDPLPKRDGAVMIDVSFDRGPAGFRVVATTADEAYALLYELATSTVEAVREPGIWQFCGAAEAEVPESPDNRGRRGWFQRKWRSRSRDDAPRP